MSTSSLFLSLLIAGNPNPDLDALWADLARTEAKVGYKAIWGMVNQPDASVRFLKKHLQPPAKEDAENLLRPLRAIEVLERIGTAEARAMLEQFAKGPQARFAREAQAASQRLARLQDRPHVQKEKKLDPLEQLWKDLGEADAVVGFRAVRSLTKQPGKAVSLIKARLKPATQAEKEAPELLLSGDALRAARAIEVLELIGTAEARDVLQTLAKGAPSRLTREAQAAIERLKRRM